MGQVEDSIRTLIVNQYGSIPKFAAAVGLPTQTVYSALRNSLATASAATTVPIARALKLDPFRLVAGELVSENPHNVQMSEVPLVEEIAASQVIDEQKASATYPIPADLAEKYKDAFLVKMEDESMNRILPKGSYALVNPSTKIERPREPYAVAVGDSKVSIKRAVALNNGIELAPDSTDPTYKAQIYNYNEPNTDQVKVIGEVVWFCVPFDWNF